MISFLALVRFDPVLGRIIWLWLPDRYLEVPPRTPFGFPAFVVLRFNPNPGPYQHMEQEY